MPAVVPAADANRAAGAPLNRTLLWVVGAVLGLVIVGILISFVRQTWQAQERRSYAKLPSYRQVPAFTLTERMGKIYDLARNAFMLPTVDNQNNPGRKADEGDFIHSEKIALVDRQGVVRRYFDSTDPEVVQQVMTAMGDLLREQPDAPARTAKGIETLKTGT